LYSKMRKHKIRDEGRTRRAAARSAPAPARRAPMRPDEEATRA
jgi:hypothetical protein